MIAELPGGAYVLPGKKIRRSGVTLGIPRISFSSVLVKCTSVYMYNYDTHKAILV